MPRIAADLHCHTIASSHAYGTFRELVETAVAKGLSALAVTDHGPALPDSPHPWYFGNLHVLPRRIDGLVLLRGAEVNICDLSGRLDLERPVLERLDWIVASFHDDVMAPGSMRENTEAYLAVLENPLVDALGHTGSVQYPYEIDTVVKACREVGRSIEINSGSFKVRPSAISNCRRIAESCARHGTTVVVTSDAHSPWDVGEVGAAMAMLDSIGFPEELILNAEKDRLFRAIETRKGRPIV